jgi:uncharacterized protein YkwD
MATDRGGRAGALAAPIAAVVAAMALGLPTPAAAAAAALSRPALAKSFTSAMIVAAFNRIRTANGLPPVTENRTWDADCHLHELYESANGFETHYEQKGRPGYTAGGAFAGRNAVLAEGFGEGSWAYGDPWATAPIHLSQMMSPALRSVGAYEYTDAKGVTWDCLTTWPGYEPQLFPLAKQQRLYSYPGNGTRWAPTEMTASEAPTVPNGWVGLPTQGSEAGGVTGPFIYLYWAGPEPGPVCTHNPKWPVCMPSVYETPSPVAATLEKPDGQPADTRLVSQKAIARAGYAGYIPRDAALLVPVYPLKPGTTYTVRVVFGMGSVLCPTPPAGTGVKSNWCAPDIPAFSASMRFTTAGA